MSIKGSRFVFVVLGVILINIILILSVSGIASTEGPSGKFEKLPLKNGDIVLRAGHGLVSKWFRQCSLQDPSFSHAGLIVIKNSRVYVAHLQQTKNGNPLKWEPISQFWNPDVCSMGAVYRTDLKEGQLKQIVESVYQDEKNTPEFDFEFELNDDGKYYCSEWIREKFIVASGDISYFPVTTVDDYHYVAPDNLYLNPHSRFIYRFKYP